MSQKCQKCGKEYEPKRRGGKFCSTSCRVTWYQLGKKDALPPIPNQGDELYLASKLAAIGRSSREVLAKVQGLPAEQALAELQELVRSWAGVTNNTVIERILANDERDRSTNYAAYRKRTGLF